MPLRRRRAYGDLRFVIWHYNTIEGFSSGSEVKNLPANARTQEIQVRSLGPGWSPGGGHWKPTPSFLPAKFHGEALQATIHGIRKGFNMTRLTVCTMHDTIKHSFLLGVKVWSNQKMRAEDGLYPNAKASGRWHFLMMNNKLKGWEKKTGTRAEDMVATSPDIFLPGVNNYADSRLLQIFARGMGFDRNQSRFISLFCHLLAMWLELTFSITIKYENNALLISYELE